MLPLTQFLVKIDGKTMGLSGFTRKERKSLLTCQYRPVVEFKVINDSLPLRDTSVLSKDQAYHYEIFQAIHFGSCPLISPIMFLN